MKNKKKKGFTLIELLAIIVILAIIAVITVPIILNIIENSRRGAATDSAYGYKDAVNKWYVSKLQEDNQFQLASSYTISSDGKLGDIVIPVSGDKPSGGYLNYSNNTLTGGCLVIGDYAVTFEGGNATSTIKGDCSSSSNNSGNEQSGSENEQGSNTPTQSIVQLYESDGVTPKSKENIAVRDMVKIGDEGFEVINTNSNGNIVLLAEYNLKEQQENNTMVWKQYNGAYDENDTYFIVEDFAEENYWYGPICAPTIPGGEDVCDGVGFYHDYETTTYTNLGDEYVDVYIYRRADGTEEENNVVEYINYYKNYLQSLGQNIADARILSRHEAESNISLLSNNQIYRLGSSHPDGQWPYCVNQNNLYANCYTAAFSGIRPVIEISISEF